MQISTAALFLQSGQIQRAATRGRNGGMENASNCLPCWVAKRSKLGSEGLKTLGDALPAWRWYSRERREWRRASGETSKAGRRSPATTTSFTARPQGAAASAANCNGSLPFISQHHYPSRLPVPLCLLLNRATCCYIGSRRVPSTATTPRFSGGETLQGCEWKRKERRPGCFFFICHSQKADRLQTKVCKPQSCGVETADAVLYRMQPVAINLPFRLACPTPAFRQWQGHTHTKSFLRRDLRPCEQRGSGQADG